MEKNKLLIEEYEAQIKNLELNLTTVQKNSHLVEEEKNQAHVQKMALIERCSLLEIVYLFLQSRIMSLCVYFTITSEKIMMKWKREIKNMKNQLKNSRYD